MTPPKKPSEQVKLENKKSFSDLAQLREELTKEAQNKERLSEYQKTIDLALEQGKKKGVIEFTETEWKSLISNENLPPFEEVQALLQEKIASAKEVASETKEKTGGLIEELQQKAEDLTDGAKKKMDALQQKVEDLKKYTKPGLWILGIGLSLKIWGLKIANWFSGLFGNKGEYDGKLKLAEMEKEFLENPEAAMKKYGTDALKIVKEKGGDNLHEKKEWAREKIEPLAALSWAGIWIFSLLKSKLPSSLANKLAEGVGDKSFLGKLAKNRALRLFGISGVTLFSIGKLYEYIEKNGASLWNIPIDTEGKKSWWKNVIEKAWIGVKDGAEEIWSTLNGEKVEKYFEEKGPRPGYQFLESSDLLKDVKWKIRLLADKLELIYKKDPVKFEAAFIGIGIFKPWIIFGAVWAWSKGLELARTVLKVLYWSAKNHPLLWSLELAMLGSQVEGVKHIQIPEWMTLDTISETISDITSMEHIQEKLENIAPGFMTDNVKKISEYFENNCAKLGTEIEYVYTHWQENLDAGMRNFLVTEEREKITWSNKIGLEAFQKDLHVELWEDKIKNIEALIWKDKKSGILWELISKSTREEPLTESDVYKLIAATEGTNIRIFPEGGTRDWRTIQWIIVDEKGNPEWTAKNICINPLKEENEKVEIANDFIYDPTSLSFLSKFSHEAYNEGRDLISNITKSITAEPGKAKSGIEKIMWLWASIWYFWGKMFIEYLDQVYIIGPANLLSALVPEWKELTGQEFLVEYAGGMVPVLFINGLKRSFWKWGGLVGKWFGKLGWKVLAESILYPIKLPADIGKFIYTKYMHGDLGHIFETPGLHIREGFAERMRNVGIMPQSLKDFWNLVHQKEKLHHIHEKLKKINILKWLGSWMEKKAQKMMDEVFDTIRREWLLSRFPGRTLDSINIHESEKLLTETKAAIDKIHLDVETNWSKTLQELKEKLSRTSNPQSTYWYTKNKSRIRENERTLPGKNRCAREREAKYYTKTSGWSYNGWRIPKVYGRRKSKNYFTSWIHSKYWCAHTCSYWRSRKMEKSLKMSHRNCSSCRYYDWSAKTPGWWTVKGDSRTWWGWMRSKFLLIQKWRTNTK